MTTQQENNTFIKILIILVIASLSLLAIVYVFNKAQTSEEDRNLSTPNKIEEIVKEFDDKGKIVINDEMETTDGENRNLSTPNKIEKTVKEFDDKGKIVINDEMETTDNCGFLGCSFKIYNENNWKTGDTYDVLVSKANIGIEFTIPNFTECSNDNYIIPPYIDDQENKFIRIMPYQQDHPCLETYQKSAFKTVYIKNKKDKTLKIEDYLNDPNLIKDKDLNPKGNYEIITRNNIKAIPFTSYGHSTFGCFFISGENYNYIISGAFDLPENYSFAPKNIDTSALDNIKILK